MNVAAALALAQEASYRRTHPRDLNAALPPGMVYAFELRPGDVFYRSGSNLGDDGAFCIIEQEPVTMIRSGGTRDDLDIFGRPMLALWCRCEVTRREGWMPFGPGGAVRVAESLPYAPLSPAARRLLDDAAELARWEADGGT